MRWPIRKQIIYGCDLRGDGESPYLTRWVLLKTRLGSLYLHLFHRSDADDRHDHPFAFVSLILWRGYIEEVAQGVDETQGTLRVVTRRRKWPGMILFRRASHIHRVELIDGKPAVTLAERGPKVREWGFFTPVGWIQWQEYFERLGCK